MRRFALVALAAAVLAPAAAAAKITAEQQGASVVVTAKMQTAGTYAASCTFPGWNIGTGGVPSNANGKVVVQVLLGPPGRIVGAFTCWLRPDPSLFNTPPAALKGGKPATVSGVVQ